MGRAGDALVEARRAIELDPFVPVHGSVLGLVLTANRMYDEAIERLKKTIELDPVLRAPHRNIERAYRMKGLREEAAKQIQQIGAPPKLYEICFSVGRDRTKSIALLQQYQVPDEWKHFLPEIYVELRMPDKAFEILNQLIDERSPEMQHLIQNPVLDPVRSDPRYADLLKRMGVR
jgi:tetratricopeptide (TPR) repeat protein